MKIFNIFRKVTKDKNQKPVYQLNDMWMCRFCFDPSEKDGIDVIYKKVEIGLIKVCEHGFWVEPKHDYYGGFVERFTSYDTSRRMFNAFFDTKEKAQIAYKDFMEKWIANIRTSMEKE